VTAFAALALRAMRWKGRTAPDADFGNPINSVPRSEATFSNALE